MRALRLLAYLLMRGFINGSQKATSLRARCGSRGGFTTQCLFVSLITGATNLHGASTMRRLNILVIAHPFISIPHGSGQQCALRVLQLGMLFALEPWRIKYDHLKLISRAVEGKPMSLDIVGWIIVIALLIALWLEANGARTAAELHHKWTARKLEELEAKIERLEQRRGNDA